MFVAYGSQGLGVSAAICFNHFMYFTLGVLADRKFILNVILKSPPFMQ